MNTNLSATTIEVIPLNMERVNKDINDLVHKQFGEDEYTYDTRSSWAICEKRLSMVDDECIFWPIGNEHDQIFELGIYSHTQTSFGMFPKYNIKLSIKELMEYKQEPKILAKFMGSRYEYNSRIKGNTSNYLRWVEYGDIKQFNKVTLGK